MTTEQINEVDRIIDEVLRRVPDSGTCVGGMNLKLNGSVLVPQLSQGSITNEVAFKRISDYLEDEGVFGVSIDYGWMD